VVNVLPKKNVLFYFKNIDIGPTGAMLTVTGRTTALLLMTVVASVCNLVLNPLLIPIYGILGAAISSAVAYVLFSLLCAIHVQRQEGFHPFRLGYLRAVILFSGLSAGFLLLRWATSFPIPTLVWIMVFLMCYLLLLYWTKSLPYLPFSRLDRLISPSIAEESLEKGIVYNQDSKKG